MLIIASTEQGRIIDGGPGMWELIQKKFLLPESTFHHDKVCEFTLLDDEGRKCTVPVFILGIFLDPRGSDEEGNRKINAFVCTRDYCEATCQGRRSNAALSKGFYQFNYDPRDRSGTCRRLTDLEENMFRKMLNLGWMS